MIFKKAIMKQQCTEYPTLTICNKDFDSQDGVFQ